MGDELELNIEEVPREQLSEEIERRRNRAIENGVQLLDGVPLDDLELFSDG